METTRDSNSGQWTDQRLAALRSAVEWNPDASRGLSLLREKLDADARGHKRRTWAIGAVGIVCATVLAFPVTRAFAQRCVDACVDQASRVSGLLWRGFSPQAATSPGLASSGFLPAGRRTMAPDFRLTDAAGQAVKLADFRGRVVLLNFWATWCAPCKIEIPWFVEFERTYRDRNFAVVGVSMDEGGWKDLKPYIESAKMNYPVVLGDDDVSAAFGGIDSLPATFLIDKAGRMASVHVGLCGKGDYEAEIKALLEE